ncbi:MAG: class II D-tagatose-bisphosphate aldolase, non-catalytic subunit [Pseudomonadota bacterium]
MIEPLRDIIRRNRAGEAVAIPSVCSAHPDVLRASMGLAGRLSQPIVIEATSNQVNQDGGYMGMTPIDFVRYVHGLADAAGTDRDAILFGGDHLGTQAWKERSTDEAMDKAQVLVTDFVRAGFKKIHLDCSEGCAGEARQLNDPITADRSAKLARACTSRADDLLFVVGTEVPPPGGARVDDTGDIVPTDPAAARQTLAAHDDAFAGMAPMIGGLVVQPGVEFSPTAVHHMPLDRDPGLLAAVIDRPGVCLEAHSTDYQRDAVFPRLAKLGFGFQKVGPALTFAYRDALYALDQIRPNSGALQNAMEEVMLANPIHWAGHYAGDEAALYQQRHFGLADRIRYYWPTSEARAAVKALHTDLQDTIPDEKLRAFFDTETLDRAEGLRGPQIQRLIDARIERALAPYCFMGRV